MTWRSDLLASWVSYICFCLPSDTRSKNMTIRLLASWVSYICLCLPPDTRSNDLKVRLLSRNIRSNDLSKLYLSLPPARHKVKKHEGQIISKLNKLYLSLSPTRHKVKLLASWVSLYLSLTPTRHKVKWPEGYIIVQRPPDTRSHD